MTDGHETEPWLKTRAVLELGGWWEVLPSDMNHFMSHARAYVASDKVDPAAKERVRRVWLEHHYAPAWHKFTPRQPAVTEGGTLVDRDGVVVDDDAPF